MQVTRAAGRSEASGVGPAALALAAIVGLTVVVYLLIVVVPFYVYGIAGQPELAVLRGEFDPTGYPLFARGGSGDWLRVAGATAMMFTPVAGVILVLWGIWGVLAGWRRQPWVRLAGPLAIAVGAIGIYFVISPVGREVITWFSAFR